MMNTLNRAAVLVRLWLLPIYEVVADTAEMTAPIADHPLLDAGLEKQQKALLQAQPDVRVMLHEHSELTSR
jgi:hypothetical protein